MPRLRGLKLRSAGESDARPVVGITMPRLRGLKPEPVVADQRTGWNHYAPSKGIET